MMLTFFLLFSNSQNIPKKCTYNSQYISHYEQVELIITLTETDMRHKNVICFKGGYQLIDPRITSPYMTLQCRYNNNNYYYVTKVNYLMLSSQLYILNLQLCARYSQLAHCKIRSTLPTSGCLSCNVPVPRQLWFTQLPV